jgi:hypothetical protein
MHIMTKDSVQNEEQAKALGLSVGTHIVTCTIEGDGAVELASDKAIIEASVISKQRTTSGGVQVQVAVYVKEPAAQVLAVLTPDQQAVDYFLSKGFTAGDAASQVAKFGVARVLTQRDKEAAQASVDLDKELEQVLAGNKPAKAPKVN